MEVVIDKAEEYQTKTGRDTIKITLSNGKVIFIAAEATYIIENLSKQVHIPIITKQSGLCTLNLNKLKGKIIKVKTEKYKDKDYLSFDWK